METKKLIVSGKADKFGKALQFKEIDGWFKVIDDPELNKFWDELEKNDVILVEFDGKLIGDMYFENTSCKEVTKATTMQLKPVTTDLGQTSLSMQIAYQNVIKTTGFVYYSSKLPPKDFAKICKETFKELYGIEYK